MLTWCILKGALITYLVTLKLMKVTNPQHRMYNSNIYQIFISFAPLLLILLFFLYRLAKADKATTQALESQLPHISTPPCKYEMEKEDEDTTSAFRSIQQNQQPHVSAMISHWERVEKEMKIW